MSADDEEEVEFEEEEEEEDEEADENNEENGEVTRTGEVGIYNSTDVNDQAFEELWLPCAAAQEVQESWALFLGSADSRDAAGEAIYAALFDSAPSLQSLFKTPRAVMAMRFMNGLNQIIGQLQDPKALKVVVETLGFQHLDLEVTVPRVVIFRDAIVDLLQVDLGARVSPRALEGWATVLNYVGGAYIFVRTTFSVRLKILASSWATANNKANELDQLDEAGDDDGKVEAVGSSEGANPGVQEDAAEQKKESAAERRAGKRGGFFGFGEKDDVDAKDSGGGVRAGSSEVRGESAFRNTSVPTTFNEMFMFNAAVMGFGSAMWMHEVLLSFDTIVCNVANSYRLQEECDVLSLRMAKFKGTVSLPEYKAVMLASLRSLVPKDWNSDHEVAWSWLWDNVERMLKSLTGKPQLWERSLERLYASLDENARGFVRREVYSKFFTLAPAGQDFFKQSTTRLHFIADRIVIMTLDMYKDPKKMVEDISALGLRHVGYGIPTDMFGPFVTACVQVIRTLTDDDVAEEAFRWSLSLISRVLVRVITEGSTIVMKAINSNSAKQLKKAVACAPRGKRALWVLNIQVGTQSISPFLWAIETGSLEAARAIIQDLLTIRADRDRYYYGMDTMFERHYDIIHRLCGDAPALLPVLLDGLVWRSRATESGMRRVNYYIKHLLVDLDGNFSKTIEWTTDNGDPKLVCHPVLAMVTDMIWSRVAFRSFLYSKSWLLFTLLVFITGTAFLKHLSAGDNSQNEMYAVFSCRAFIYTFSLGQWLYFHLGHMARDVRARRIAHLVGLPVPEYLTNFQDQTSLVLTVCLSLMVSCEPIIRCFGNQSGDFEGSGAFTERCPEADRVRFIYSLASSLALFCYFLLTVDLAVFSTRVSAFVLISTRVMSEVGLFLFAAFFIILAFSCSMSALEHTIDDFAGIHKSFLSLVEICLRMYPSENFTELKEEPALFVAVVLFILSSILFLTNLLIAQLNCAYESTYLDMVGYARLNRGKIVTEAMVGLKEQRWMGFVNSLRLDERVEFGEGDIGLAGGVQVLEPASANITTVEMIRRFGGSTSPAAQWPADENDNNDEDDKFERLEKQIEKAMKRMKGSGRRSAGGSTMGSTMLGTAMSGSNDSMAESGSGSSNH
jgi:hemoglobin-like flavoprotein